MSSQRNIRDPIHGFVAVEGRELDVLDTPLFQRLRRIRQLAMAHLVYPGALHTRFDHTLGVLHVAGQLCTQLEVDDSHTRIIRLAALLHDIGHGPFSHVSESILTQISGPELAKTAGKKDKIHELITQQIIVGNSDLANGLSQRDREEVVQLLRDGLDRRVYRDIISGPLDADKQDYLLRDSYFCGVRYGVYDIAQLHKTLTTASDAGDEIMVVDGNGLHGLEQFVLAKYYLTTQVYRHKVRLITDSMLVRAMLLGVEEDRLPFLEALYRFPADEAKRPEFLTNYLGWDDQRLSVELLKDEYAGSQAGALFRRLVERRLFKRVIDLKIRDLPAPLSADISERFEGKRPLLEAEVAEELSLLTGQPIPASQVILHLYKIDSVRRQARNDEAGMLIKHPGRLVRFEAESVLFESIDEGLRDENLDCYAPLPPADEKQRRFLREKMRAWFLTRLKQHFGSTAPLTTDHAAHES